MKKFFMMAAICAMFSAAAMAENKEVANENNKIEYSFSLNMVSVSRYLALTDGQTEALEAITRHFNNELKRIGKANIENRNKRFYNALSMNIAAAHTVLNQEQFGKYMYVVNSAISKRGLDQILTEYYFAMK